MNLCRDEEEILAYLEDNEIGSELAIFYEIYADYYERIGNYEEAERIF